MNFIGLFLHGCGVNDVIDKIARFDWPAESKKISGKLFPDTEYCIKQHNNFFNLQNVSYPYIEKKTSKMFRTPYFHESLKMFHAP